MIKIFSATTTTRMATTTPTTRGVLNLIFVPPLDDNVVLYAAEGAILLPTLILEDNVNYIPTVIMV
jgi:hypothetical protein